MSNKDKIIDELVKIHRKNRYRNDFLRLNNVGVTNSRGYKSRGSLVAGKPTKTRGVQGILNTSLRVVYGQRVG